MTRSRAVVVTIAGVDCEALAAGTIGGARPVLARIRGDGTLARLTGNGADLDEQMRRLAATAGLRMLHRAVAAAEDATAVLKRDGDAWAVAWLDLTGLDAEESERVLAHCAERRGALLVLARAADAHIVSTAHIERWLEEDGFLVRKGGSAGRGAGDLGVGVYALVRAIRRSGLAWLPRTLTPMVTSTTTPATTDRGDRPHVDWSRTRAYAAATPGGVRINIRGRDPHGIVAASDVERVVGEIRAALLARVDSGTGARVAGTVRRGGGCEDGPDLVIGAHHDSDGAAAKGAVLLVAPDGRGGTCADDVDVRDVAPTVLHLLGMAMPADLDGTAATHLLAGAPVDGDLAASEPSRSRGDATLAGAGIP